MGRGVYGGVNGGRSNNGDNEGRYGSHGEGQTVGSDYVGSSRDGAGSSGNGGSNGCADDDGWPRDDGDVPAGGADDGDGSDDNDPAVKGMHEAATAVTMVSAVLLAALVFAAVAMTAKTVPKMETFTLGVMYLSVLVAAPMLLRLAYREENREESSGADSCGGRGGNGESQ